MNVTDTDPEEVTMRTRPSMIDTEAARALREESATPQAAALAAYFDALLGGAK